MPASARVADLLKNANISARIKELQTHPRGAGYLVGNKRTKQQLQHKLELLDMLIAARAAEMKDYPGAATGLLVKGYKGKDAQQMVLRYDSASCCASFAL